MTQLNQNQIPVTFVNLYTQDRLVQAMLPALPTMGDDIYLHGWGYEVANCAWTLLADAAIEIAVLVRPRLNADGERPFSYDEEEAE